MKIYIPSRGRATEEEQLTLRTLNAAGVSAVLVVPVKEYKHYFSKFASDLVKIEACDAVGISNTRQWILDHTVSRTPLMFDDDMSFFKRPSMRKATLLRCTSKDIHKMLDRIEELAELYPMVGLSARQGNNHVSSPEVEVTRSMNVYAFNRETLHRDGVKFGRTRLMGDFDVTLQLLRMGHKNVVIYDYCWHQRGSNAPGGCSLYRNGELLERTAKKLARLHPGLVTLVTKESKSTWHGMQVRTDVRIAWKKAFNRG